MLHVKTGFSGPVDIRATRDARTAAADFETALAPVRTKAWSEIAALDSVSHSSWTRLAAQTLEPNAFYEPAWVRSLASHAGEDKSVRLLAAWTSPGRTRLLGLLPVVSAWHACKLPVPMLVAWQAYAPLVTPLIDRGAAEMAWHGLLDAAASAGAQALLLPGFSAAGAAAGALDRVLAQRELPAHAISQFERASLDTTLDADVLLRDALGPKKLKELRRQRNRLGDCGAVTFDVARGLVSAAAALEQFLALEARGWKARRGTALVQSAQDAAFIREAVPALAAQGRCEIVTLAHGGVPVAAGIVLRQNDRAFFFKIAIDEDEARNSPGVQLTLDLTRHLCAEPALRFADSTADANHPMIDHVWRGRLAIADLFVPLRPRSRAARAIRNLVTLRAAARRRVRSLYHAIRALTEYRP